MAYEKTQCRCCREAGAKCSKCREYDRKYALYRKLQLQAEGKCYQCGTNPVRPGLRHGRPHRACEECAEKARQYARRKTSKGTSQHQKYKAAGRCVVCGGPRDRDGVVRCRTCLARAYVAGWIYRHPDPDEGLETGPSIEALPERAVEPIDRLEVVDSIHTQRARAKLSPREWQIIDLRVGLSNRVPAVWADIATVIGVSSTRVQTIFDAAICKLGGDPRLLDIQTIRSGTPTPCPRVRA